MNEKPTILYVEDEESIRKQLTRFLGYFSSELFVAENGEDGFNLFQKHKPDIVVSDIKMPKMNGIEMVAKIKEQEPHQHILFTTAHSESGYFIDAIDLQVDGYILKPVNLKKLERKIEHISQYIFNEKILKEKQILLDEIANLQDHLIVIIDKNEKLIYANKMFLNFFQVNSIEEFEKKHPSFEKLFKKHEDFSDSDYDDALEIRKLEETDQTFIVSTTDIKETLHTIISITEVTNLADETKVYKQQAYHDALTQLYNRTYFNQQLKKEIGRHKRDGNSLSFLIFDIDFFKKFNDEYGHNVGDEVLQELANLVQENTRITDTLARWGGEEFVEILPNTSLDEAKKVAELLRNIVENHIFSQNLHVTCSFGVAEFLEYDDEKSVIQRADQALYRAKEMGRNRVES